MQRPRPLFDAFKAFSTFALSCLGLSGISDNFVEWKTWYEFGIMQHWRSFKDFTYETFLFWVPFEIPDWSIDYLLLGAIFARAYWSAQSSEFREILTFGTTKDYEIYQKLERGESERWAHFQIKLSLILAFVIVLLLLVPLWPLILLLTVHAAFAGRDLNPKLPLEDGEVEEYMLKMRRLGAPSDYATLKRFMVIIALFFPFLFLVTNELPKLLSSL